ncbi:MAG: hypothetical protein M1839_002575 [Geoglossum umbratile]|nr:MAG: hypothetical protein M1839_002575 [Geoglossum umbratile]
MLAGPSNPTAFDTYWQTIQSEHATLTHLKKHLDGTVGSLLQSAERGCGLCDLIAKQLRRLSELASASAYHIFIWGRIPATCEFKVALGDINRFTEHISKWQQPESLVFFRRNGASVTSEDLEKPGLLRNGSWPSLPVLADQNPGSRDAFHRAQGWLADCTKRHKECIRLQSKLPKRVLDLGESEELSNIALYITTGEIAPYATLSYSWGKSPRLLTERKTLTQHCRGISLDEFPKTLRDAIRIAKALGFRYLWIDSLCIIQGDDLDWAEQGAAMTDIYGLSTLNVSASSSRNSNEGILMSLPDHGIKIGYSRHHDADSGWEAIFVGHPNETLDLEENHISSRGWVFQERLVSTATLHYTNEGMVWECASGISLEHDQSLSSVRWKADWKAVMDRKSPTPKTPSNVRQTEVTANDPYENWNDWVCAYSQRNLSDVKDKFPAIAGVAKTFASVFGLTYAAGLWEENIVSGLLWRRYSRTRTLTRFKEYVAPSWSWASVHGRLEYRNVNIIESKKGLNLKVSSVNIDEEHPETFGRVRGGKIVAEGLLQAVVVDRSIHPYVRKKSYQECGIAEGFVNRMNVLCMLDEYVESAPPHYPCWCLRVGSYDSYGREGDLFLLLERAKAYGNEFRRIGFAETDPWENVISPSANSGSFVSGQLARVVLI